MITLTNLIPSPSMEGNGWNGTYSTEHSYVGTRSLKMSGASGSAETTCSTTASIPLIPSHTYYARVYGYQDSKTNGAAVGFYWPIAEPNFNDNLPVGDAGKWNLYSAVNNRTSFSSGSYPFRLDWNNRGTAGTIYYDGCMLIDLTACFGAGNELDQAWCDENIPYFEGEMDLEASIAAIPSIESASITPNPSNINSPILIRAFITEKAVILTPVYFYTGEIQSGEV